MMAHDAGCLRRKQHSWIIITATVVASLIAGVVALSIRVYAERRWGAERRLVFHAMSEASAALSEQHNSRTGTQSPETFEELSGLIGENWRDVAQTLTTRFIVVSVASNQMSSRAPCLIQVRREFPRWLLPFCSGERTGGGYIVYESGGIDGDSAEFWSWYEKLVGPRPAAGRLPELE